jgi:hypothetical protein
MSEKLPELSQEKKTQNGLEAPLLNSPFDLSDKMLEAEFDEVYRNYPISDDTSCGLGFLRGKILQK